MRVVRVGFASFILFFFVWALVEASDWSLGARLFPWVVGWPMLFLAGIQWFKELRAGERDNRSEPEPEARPGLSSILPAELEPPVAVHLARTFRIAAWFFGFFLAVWLLGFTLAIPLLVFLYLWSESRESGARSLILAGSAWGFFYGLFDRLLHLPFPEGEFFRWAGW